MQGPDKFTNIAQATLAHAFESARAANHPEVDPLHLLNSLIHTNGPSRQLLHSIHPSPPDLETQIQSALDGLPITSNTSQPRISLALNNTLTKADELSQAFGDTYISQEVLLLALTEDNNQATKLLNQNDINATNIRKEIQVMRQDKTVSETNSDTKYQVLDKYTTNFTALAKEGKLDPVIGRDSEIRRVMQVLSRRTKNNPVLIGEPGVGKTAIIEGLAQRIVSGDVPVSLKHKQLLSLEISSVLAGAKYRGEFEDRFKSIIDEVQKREGEIILFIDELHTIHGAGGDGGAVDASNMLKPGLARGTLRVIGATTLNEYRQHIEKDAALERRFQPVMVKPPSVEDTTSILRGLKEKYEIHHGIHINDEAIVAAAELSDRYIADRFLPDKAIDLIDEAASALKIITESEPEELDQLKREITQIQIELKALKKDQSETATQKKKDLTQKLETQDEKRRTLDKSWERQKKVLEEIQSIRNKQDELKVILEHAERDIDLDKAAKIKYGDLPEIEARLKDQQAVWETIPDAERLIKQEVSKADIASVVARWTGIPVTKLVQSETQKLTHLEEELGKRVIGQSEALSAIANAIRRSRAGLSEPNRPIATFMFLGPTGVGKTETAKALAGSLFDDDKKLVRIDMSEYAEKHSVARLIGAPPGYIGFEAGGQLTEVVRRNPYSVILFDEIEKAHPEIYNLFLQIFDEGRLTDGQGRTVNFTNTVLIMTSNLGATAISQAGDKLTSEVQDQILGLIKNTYPPEFINRLDQIIIFEPLSPKELVKIVDIQLEGLLHRLAKQNITLEVSKPAKEYLAKTGYDVIYGARPLKRLIQTEILDPLALKVIEGQLDGQKVIVNLNNDQLTLDLKPIQAKSS